MLYFLNDGEEIPIGETNSPLSLHGKAVEGEAMKIALHYEAQLRLAIPEDAPIWRMPAVMAANAPNN